MPPPLLHHFESSLKAPMQHIQNHRGEWRDFGTTACCVQDACAAWNALLTDCFSLLSPGFHCFFHSGISLAQDSRFKSADKKLLAKMKFAPELDQKVDLNKVEIGTLRAQPVRIRNGSLTQSFCSRISSLGGAAHNIHTGI